MVAIVKWLAALATVAVVELRLLRLLHRLAVLQLATVEAEAEVEQA
jgi:hypothetical protein